MILPTIWYVPRWNFWEKQAKGFVFSGGETDSDGSRKFSFKLLGYGSDELCSFLLIAIYWFKQFVFFYTKGYQKVFSKSKPQPKKKKNYERRY